MARTYRASFVLQGFASTFGLILLFQVGRLVERASPSYLDGWTAVSWDQSRGRHEFGFSRRMTAMSSQPFAWHGQLATLSHTNRG